MIARHSSIIAGQITSRIEQLHTRRERDILRAQKMQQLSDFHQGQIVGLKLDHDMEKDDTRMNHQGKPAGPG